MTGHSRDVTFFGDDRQGESLIIVATILADGRVEYLEIRGTSKHRFDTPTFEHLKTAVAKYPTAERVVMPVPLDDSVAELLKTLTELTHVYAGSVTLSERGAKTLCGIPSLQVLLVEDFDDESEDRIRQFQPAFEIRRGRVPSLY